MDSVSCHIVEFVYHFLGMTEMEQNWVNGGDWATVKDVCTDTVVCG